MIEKRSYSVVAKRTIPIMAATILVLVTTTTTSFLSLPYVGNIQIAYGQGFQNIVQGVLTKPGANVTLSAPSFPSVHGDVGGEQVGTYAIIHSGNNIVATVTMDVPPPTRGNVYEAWLFDDATGYYHSLGMLSTTTFGPTPTTIVPAQDRLSITTDMVNPYLYDKIVVTEESQNNLAPSPSTIIAGGSDIPDPFGK